MADTSIQWTDKSWSPLRARVKADAAAIATAKGYTSLIPIATKMAGHVGPHCERVSHGCDRCYSDTNNGRCLPANGTGLPFDRRSRDLVDTFVDEKILVQPLKWRAPKKVFVENQSDLFGEWVTDEQIDRVFAVMALCPQHTFQVLTKRPERMLAYFDFDRDAKSAKDTRQFDMRGCVVNVRARQVLIKAGLLPKDEFTEESNRFIDGDSPWLHASGPMMRWPLLNVWLGVSCEDQTTADARIPLLLHTPAAVRFVSYEPALGPVDFTALPSASGIGRYLDSLSNAGVDPGAIIPSKLDWLIVGGESGPGARPFDIVWARNTIQQCKAAGVACFVKQLGAKPYHQCVVGMPGDPASNYAVKDRKGGDMAEWREDLRVREFPAVSR